MMIDDHAEDEVSREGMTLLVDCRNGIPSRCPAEMNQAACVGNKNILPCIGNSLHDTRSTTPLHAVMLSKSPRLYTYYLLWLCAS